MRFGVLGSVAVWTDDGSAVGVPGIKVRALLADLLIHNGRPVSADRLVDDLWGEELPGNPAGSLSAKVSQLRRVLEDAEPDARRLVVSPPPGYRLRVEPDAVDAHRFLALTARAREAQDPRERADLLDEALRLWRGPAYADFADEEFTQAAVARLDEQRLTALEDHAEARLALGEHTGLADELGDQVTAHPLRERLRAAHLRALYGAGRQSEALAGYDDLRSRLADELGLDPGAELVALQRAMLNQDQALDVPTARPAPTRPRSNLPAPLTDLIGRDTAVNDVRASLDEQRLVTLTGAGGVGKTRLALAVAAQQAAAYPDGVWLVELAGFERSAAGGALTELVASALDIQDAAGESSASGPAERLAAALRPRRMLLVLDNCEHVLDEVAALVELVSSAAPGVRVLATSREPLGLTGETVWSVPPLDVPDRDADLPDLAGSSAVRLFVARATAADRTFRLDPETAGAVAVLCRRLDGIPLALELAATRVRALGVHDLVARLDDRFRLLVTGHRGAPPRQQTLTAMIDWSWELLSAPEQTVLRRLAVHRDGCTAAAAEAVCAGPDLPAAEVVDLLVRLVDRSLVVAESTPGPRRYRLLESVAAYSLDRLAAADETAELRRRHRRYYLDLAERAAAGLYGEQQRVLLPQLDAETGNLRAALDHAVADRDPESALRLANGLAWYWFLRGRLTEARRSLGAALAVTSPSRVGDTGAGLAGLRARAAGWETGFAVLAGDVADWPSRRDSVLKLYADVTDPAGEARSVWFLAYVAFDTGDLDGSAALLDRATAAFQDTGDRWGTAVALVTRAKLAHVRGDTVALERDAEEGARLFGQLGDRWGQLQASAWLGGLAEMTGDHERATRLHTDVLRLAEELGLWNDVAGALGWLAWIAVQTGDFELARSHGDQALRLAREQGHSATAVLAELGLGYAARKGGRLDEAEAHLDNLRATAGKSDPADGVPPYLPMVLIELGFLSEQRGDADRARSLHLEAIELAGTFDGSRDLTVAAEGLAGSESLSGRSDAAVLLLGAATAARESTGFSRSPAELLDVDRITARLREALGDDGFAAGLDRGRAMSLDEARSAALDS